MRGSESRTRMMQVELASFSRALYGRTLTATLTDSTLDIAAGEG